MRKIEYLSPTSRSLWMDQGPEIFYQRYLSDTRSIRDPQTLPMAVGSAFDAICKAYLYERLCGKNDKFAEKALFESQVESDNRDKAWVAGKFLMNLYKSTGALADLMLELSTCIGEPRFELDVKSIISRKSSSGVPILGKPDIFFMNSEGAHVILDWKCNGYCSASKTSPGKGYVKLRPGGTAHKDCMPMKTKGIMINGAIRLEDVKPDWAAQLCTYAWLCGEEVGDPTICGIEQMLNNDRVASHRCLVGKVYQENVFSSYLHIWEIIQSGHIFRDMDKDASKIKQDLLDQPVNDADFNSVIRAR